MNLTGFHFLSRHIISRCSIAFKRIEGTTLDYINSILKTISEIHNRSTRFANLNFHYPVFKKTQKETGPLACELLEIGTNCPWT